MTQSHLKQDSFKKPLLGHVTVDVGLPLWPDWKDTFYFMVIFWLSRTYFVMKTRHSSRELALVEETITIIRFSDRCSSSRLIRPRTAIPSKIMTKVLSPHNIIISHFCIFFQRKRHLLLWIPFPNGLISVHNFYFPVFLISYLFTFCYKNSG
jgi:hypothetical protein